MMLPILISESVTPVSYFFCASEGAVAKPRRVTPSVAESVSFPSQCAGLKRFQTGGLARRCMGLPLRQGVTSAVSSRLIFRGTIAACRSDGKNTIAAQRERQLGNLSRIALASSLHCGYLQKQGKSMRRYLRPTIVIAMVGLLFGALYRLLFDRPDEAELVNYLRSSLHGAGITLSGWAVQLYFTSRSSAWVRRWPLVVELIIRSVIMALVVATVTIALEPVLYAHGVEHHWLISDYPFIIAIAFAGSILIGAIYELVRLVGGRVLVKVILG